MRVCLKGRWACLALAAARALWNTEDVLGPDLDLALALARRSRCPRLSGTLLPRGAALEPELLRAVRAARSQRAGQLMAWGKAPDLPDPEQGGGLTERLSAAGADMPVRLWMGRRRGAPGVVVLTLP